MYSPQRHFSLHPGWLKLRLKILGPILILMLFCNVVFVDLLDKKVRTKCPVLSAQIVKNLTF